MKSHPYALVTCLATCVPWSEMPSGTPFQKYFTHLWSGSTVVPKPSEEQDLEFVTGYPLKSGSSALRKPGTACDVPEAAQTPRVLVAVRGATFDEDVDMIHYIKPLDNGTKFWVAIRADGNVAIPREYGNNRSEVHRRRPEELRHCLCPRLLEKVRERLLTFVEKCAFPSHGQSKQHKGSGSNHSQGSAEMKVNVHVQLSCLHSLISLLGKPEPIAEEKASTAWQATGMPLLEPGDTMRYNCTCARNLEFFEHISRDCCGLGLANVANKTKFLEEKEVFAAIAHASKGALLCRCRASPVNREDIHVMKVFPDSLGSPVSICTMNKYSGEFQTNYATSNPSLPTNKHRIIWMVDVRDMRDLKARRKGDRHDLRQRDIRTQTKVQPLSEGELQNIFEKGTLHIITSGSLAEYAHRISIKPDMSAPGEYLAVILPWVGNRLFQHQAMVRSASAPQTRGLGILRFAFQILKSWTGEPTTVNNILKGKVNPQSEAMKRILDRRGVSLSSDQITCFEQMNESLFHCMSIQALAGTGKTMVMAIIVEALMQKPEGPNDAVVILTPSRDLRETLMRSSDFMDQVYLQQDLGPRVVWIGRPSDAASSVESWEDNRSTGG